MMIILITDSVAKSVLRIASLARTSGLPRFCKILHLANLAPPDNIHGSLLVCEQMV